jgi:hypothetical protein
VLDMTNAPVPLLDFGRDDGSNSMSERVGNEHVRDLIRRRLEELEIRVAAASRKIGRNQAYLNQYLGRGKPRNLPENVVLPLAALLKIEPHHLRLGSVPQLEPEARPSGQPHSVEHFLPNFAPMPTGLVPLFSIGSSLDQRPRALVPSMPALEHAEAPFAVAVDQDMVGLRRGDVLFCRQDVLTRSGDRVVVLIRRRINGLAELVEQHGDRATVRGFHYGEPGVTLDGVTIAKVVGVDWS